MSTVAAGGKDLDGVHQQVQGDLIDELGVARAPRDPTRPVPAHDDALLARLSLDEVGGAKDDLAERPRLDA